ncbi:hypothetical protein VU07_03525 [Desulfobulbus sp. F4]|nr:hypothetical protein [Desulfobulbus sp. F3]MCW5200861.1 hypothetical protein [Desulfobulbus sp. F4]
MKAVEDIFAAFEFEIFSAYFHSEDFLTAQGRRKAALPQLWVMAKWQNYIG